MDIYMGDGDVVKMINQNRYGDHKNPNAHEWVLKSDVEALEQEVERLRGWQETAIKDYPELAYTWQAGTR